MIRNFYKDSKELLLDRKKNPWEIYICIIKGQSNTLRSEKKLRVKIRKTRQISPNNKFLNNNNKINNKMLCPRNKLI